MKVVLIEGAALQPVVKSEAKIIESEVKVDVISERKKYAEPYVEGYSRDRVLAVQDALYRLIKNAGGSVGPFIVRV